MIFQSIMQIRDLEYLESGLPGAKPVGYSLRFNLHLMFQMTQIFTAISNRNSPAIITAGRAGFVINSSRF